MLLAVSDITYQALIAAVATVVLAWINMRTNQTLTKVAEVSGKVHTLVNSAMEVQLKLNAELSRWKSDQTHDPADLKAADDADSLLKHHQHQQSLVDAGAK